MNLLETIIKIWPSDFFSKHQRCPLGKHHPRPHHLSHQAIAPGATARAVPCVPPQTTRAQTSLEDLLGGSTVIPWPQPLWRAQSIPPHRSCKGRKGNAVIKVESAFPVIVRKSSGWKAACKNSRAVTKLGMAPETSTWVFWEPCEPGSISHLIRQ